MTGNTERGETSSLLLLLSCSVMSDSLPPHGWHPAKLLCPWDFPGHGLLFPFAGYLSDPGIEPMSPTLAGGFFTTESLAKSTQVHICVLFWL